MGTFIRQGEHIRYGPYYTVSANKASSVTLNVMVMNAKDKMYLIFYEI